MWYGNSYTEFCRKITAGANTWRKVERVMGDTQISRKLIGQVLSSCVTPAYMYGLETMALTEKQWDGAVLQKQLDKKNSLE